MKKQTFIKGSIILMASAVGAKILGALFKIPLTNLLGGVGMSYFSCAYSLFMPVYALTVTGLTSAVARMTARSAASGMLENARKIRRTALLVFSAAGLLGSVLIFALARPFSIYSVDSPEAAAAVAMIAPSVFLGCITSVERGYYEGLSNMYPTAFSQVIEGLVKVYAGLRLCAEVTENADKIMPYFPGLTDIRALAAAAGILGVTLSSLGAVLFFAVLRLFTRRSSIASHRKNAPVMSSREIIGELVRTSLPIGVSAVVTNLTALIDMWTVIGCIERFGSGSTLPDGVAAKDMPHFIYGSFAGIALTVFNLVPSVTNMLGKGALTCITSAHESGDRNALHHGTMQALIAALVISVPAAFGMLALSGEILSFLYPRQSDEVEVCVSALRYLMPGMVCLCVSYPLFSMLQAVGKTSQPLRIMLFGTAVKLAGNVALIPLMGVDGAALSTSVCYAVILLISLRMYLKAAEIRLNPVPFLKIIYAGAVCGGGAFTVSGALRRVGVSAPVQLFCSAAIGGVLYLAVLYMVSGVRAKVNN